MKIAFCGDSFCANIHNGTWPFLIKTELNATSIWKGTQGANARGNGPESFSPDRLSPVAFLSDGGGKQIGGEGKG